MEPLLYFKSLADATRLRLVHLLSRYELSVNEIADIMKMGQSRISRHLKILSDCGILTYRRDGLWVFYSAATEGEGHEVVSALRFLFSREPVYSADEERAHGILARRTAETRSFFNDIAHEWDLIKKSMLGDINLTDVIMSRIAPCRVATDLGCGTGDLLAPLTAKAEKVIGVDNSPAMLETARRRFNGSASTIDLRLGELEHLPLRDLEADCAIINMVLHHLSSPESGIREAHRVIKKGDTLLIIDFERHSDEALRNRYGDRWLGFDRDSIFMWLSKSGFVLNDYERHAIPNGLAIGVYTSIKE